MSIVPAMLRPINEVVQSAPSIYALMKDLLFHGYRLSNGWEIYSDSAQNVPLSQLDPETGKVVVTPTPARMTLTVQPHRPYSGMRSLAETVGSMPSSAEPFNMVGEFHTQFEWIQVLPYPDRAHGLVQMLRFPMEQSYLDLIMERVRHGHTHP